MVSTICLQFIVRELYSYEPDVYELILNIFKKVYKRHYALECIKLLKQYEKPIKELMLFRSYAYQSETLRRVYQALYNTTVGGRGIFFADFAKKNPDPEQKFIGILTPNQIIKYVSKDDIIMAAHIAIFSKIVYDSKNMWSQRKDHHETPIYGIQTGHSLAFNCSEPLRKRIKLMTPPDETVDRPGLYEVSLYGKNSQWYANALLVRFRYQYDPLKGHKRINLHTTMDDVKIVRHQMKNQWYLE